MAYTVLQECNNGHKLTLSPHNYGERFDTYGQARYFVKKHGRGFIFGIVRTDRVGDVTRRYEKWHN